MRSALEEAVTLEHCVRTAAEPLHVDAEALRDGWWYRARTTEERWHGIARHRVCCVVHPTAVLVAVVEAHGYNGGIAERVAFGERTISPAWAVAALWWAQPHLFRDWRPFAWHLFRQLGRGWRQNARTAERDAWRAISAAVTLGETARAWGAWATAAAERGWRLVLP